MKPDLIPSEQRLWYFPNPSHKRQTSEAGPPAWYPDKSACPEDLTLDERERLVIESVAESDDPLEPVRYSIRRRGREIELFVSRLTRRHADGRVEIHGYPLVPGRPMVPPKALRRLLNGGAITKAEYRELVKA